MDRYKGGDYRVVAQRLRPAADALVAAVSPGAGDLVVDVAAGTGNVTRGCTARGARVIATDLSHPQLLLGRPELDLTKTWLAVADAQRLPIATGAATHALSTFGVMFAPGPELALAEMARVCAPGGWVGVTSWLTGGFQYRAHNETVHLEPPAEDEVDIWASWGTAELVDERLSAVCSDVTVVVGSLRTPYASLEAYWDRVSAASPALVRARQQLTPDTYAELARRTKAVAGEMGELTAEGFVHVDDYLLGYGRAGL